MSDLISRHDAVTIPVMPKEHRQYQTMNIDDAYELGWYDLQDCIESLPSADRPTGEWVDDCTCSICHWMHEDNNGFALITKYNYCPNCGAKMGGEPE